MKYTVSRPVEDSTKDVEWPGPDLRRWRQTILTRSGLAVPSVAAPLSAAPRSKSPSLQKEIEPIAPLSPSLRKSPTPELPAAKLPSVAQGQMRITNLSRVSSR